MRTFKNANPEADALSSIEARIAVTRGARRRAFLEWTKSRVPLGEFDELQRSYLADPARARYMLKYFDLAFYLDKNFNKAMRLKLHKSRPIKVLDIGSGPGHFLLAGEFLGHRMIGLDLPGVPVVEDMCRLFDVDWRHYRMEPKRRLPWIGRFDLITTFSAGWHQRNDGDLYSLAEWEFLLQHLVDRHLNPGGRITLFFNPTNKARIEKGVGLSSDELSRLVQRFGGTLDKKRRHICVPA